MCFEGTLFTQNGFTQQDLTLSGSGSSFNNIHSKKLNYISTTGKPRNFLFTLCILISISNRIEFFGGKLCILKTTIVTVNSDTCWIRQKLNCLQCSIIDLPCNTSIVTKVPTQALNTLHCIFILLSLYLCIFVPLYLGKPLDSEPGNTFA